LIFGPLKRILKAAVSHNCQLTPDVILAMAVGTAPVKYFPQLRPTNNPDSDGGNIRQSAAFHMSLEQVLHAIAASEL